MAYVNLISQASNNPAETFMRFRDFICKRNGTYDYSTSGIGWTLIDESYAVDEDNLTFEDYFVIYSQGEDGLQDMYFQIIFRSGSFGVSGYLHWDTVSHTGTQDFGSLTAWTNTIDANNTLWVYGDLDSVLGIARYINNYNACVFGYFPESPVDQTPTRSANAITAGNDVIVTFTAVPSGWEVGKKLFVMDELDIEMVNISAIAGNDVTFTEIVNSYKANCVFKMDETRFAQGTANFSSGKSLLIGHNGLKKHSVTPKDYYITGPTTEDPIHQGFPVRKIFLSSTTTWTGPIKNIYGTISSFSQETTHTLGTDNYRFFGLASNIYCMVREV